MQLVTLGDIDALRNAGIDVMVVPGCFSRGHGEPGQARTITVHHTAGSPNGVFPSLNLVIKGRADLRGPLCNWYVDRNGKFYAVASNVAWHAGESRSIDYTNSHAIGFECEATGFRPWPTKQRRAMAKGMNIIRKRKGLKVSDVRGHKETCAPRGRKIDPNFSMPAFRALVASFNIRPKPAALPTTASQTMAIQHIFGLVEDGKWGPITDRVTMHFRDKNHGSKHPDAVLVAKIQKVLGLRPLPYPRWGPKTDAAFRKLRAEARKRYAAL